ncbi:hypothetical protein D3C76_1362240 [compost metagenome]
MVLRVLVLEFRRQEAVARLHREADRWRKVEAIAIGTGQALNVLVEARLNIAVFIGVVAVLQIPIEPHKLSVIGEIQTTWTIR